MKRIKTKTFQFKTRGQLIIATAMVVSPYSPEKQQINVSYAYAHKPASEVDTDELKDLDLKPVFDWSNKIGVNMGGY